MKRLVSFLLILGSSNLMAESLTQKVFSYDDKYGFIRLENGRVVFIKKEHQKSLSAIQIKSGSKVKLEVDNNNEMVNLSLVEDKDNFSEEKKSLFNEPPIFIPTVVSDYSAVQAMFDRQDLDYKRVSECTDRAHIWAFDEFKSNNISTEKVFSFFTASYINRNRFKWWFHVAPLVSVNLPSGVEKYVLDTRFKDGPVKIREWTDMMVFSRRECKFTTKFSEYDVNPQTEDCYLMIQSMYYRLPADLKSQEEDGIYRDRWTTYEINNARSLGFEKKEI